ncbi:MAG: hypothetical protein F6K10_31565, partial [Moorea sp. SIO2B7]|nr:hypothetical protein [Moorena sp. SIO2B7]
RSTSRRRTANNAGKFYQRRVETARKKWITKGYKNQVDKALAFIEQIGKRNPQLLWEKWIEKFEISKLTDLENKDFYWTYFYPPSFDKLGAQEYWQQLSLDFRELETSDFGKTVATEELCSSDESPTDPLKVNLLISQLTVELIQVQVVRPWMSSSIFDSRFWQWSDQREPLSDGDESPKGSLPAYVTSLVVARNLNIELVDSEQNAAVMQDIEAGKPVYWGPFSLKNAILSGSNLIQFDGMQIVAFVCQKLPKSPNPNPTLTWPTDVSEEIVVNWLDGEYKFNFNASITQVRVIIHTGEGLSTGTDTNLGIRINDVTYEVSSHIQFKINQGNWWSLENPQYPNPENLDTATYGPFDTEGLTVKNISQVPIEFQPETTLPLWASQIEWLRLEVKVEEYGWLAYKQWQPGWSDSSKGTNYCQLQ